VINAADANALWLTLQLALASTSILLLLGTPLAWWLAHSRWRLRPLIEAVIALPLVLPPTVLGFYLLISLGPDGLGGLLSAWTHRNTLAFSFGGLLIGSVVYSLPFVVQPLQNGFALLGRAPMEAAATLRASPLDAFVSVAIPQAKPAFISAATLGFAHTLGEFGVVLMLGGNIPGSTKVASIAVYEHVEALRYGNAHILSALLLLISFGLLCVVYTTQRREGH
jgi:molybdate transport system permease protein